MTEDEAMRQKWCPFARVARPKSPTAYNRWASNHDESIATNSRCLGSACMAWRWIEPDGFNKPTWVHPHVLKTHWHGWIVTDPTPDANGYVEISPPPLQAQAGYCGLAGKP